jgi:hypothetical protein
MSDYAHVDQHYVPHVEAARDEALAHRSLRALLSDELDARALLGFLIEFSALGVRMLRPVEANLRRGAVACSEAGFDSLAADFTRLSKDSASRRLRLIDDLVQLSSLWRERFDAEGLDLGALVRRPAPRAALRHAAVREAAVADTLPFGLIGVELELGVLAMASGSRLLRSCERKLGAAILERASYLHVRSEHAALRADDLLERLDDLLRAVPELGPPIACAGGEALRAQIAVLAACVNRGRRLARASASTSASAL